jgi:hypothetical protein
MKKSETILAGTMVARAIAMQGTVSNAQTETSGQSTSTTESIRPYKMNVPQEKLVDLRSHFAAWEQP